MVCENLFGNLGCGVVSVILMNSFSHIILSGMDGLRTCALFPLCSRYRMGTPLPRFGKKSKEGTIAWPTMVTWCCGDNTVCDMDMYCACLC